MRGRPHGVSNLLTSDSAITGEFAALHASANGAQSIARGPTHPSGNAVAIALTIPHRYSTIGVFDQVGIGAGVDRGVLQLRSRMVAEGLQNDAKGPVVELMSRKSAIMDTGRCAVARRGVSAAVVIHSAKVINSAHSVSTIRSHDGRLPRPPQMTGELS